MGAKEALKIISLIVAVLFAVFVFFKGKAFWDDYQSLKTYKQEAEARGESAQQTTESLGNALTGKQSVEIRVLEARAQSDRQFEEMKRENPTVRAWAEQPIPDELRQHAASEPSVQRSPDHPSGRSSDDGTNTGPGTDPGT